MIGDPYGIHEEADIWLFQHFMKCPAKGAVIIQLHAKEDDAIRKKGNPPLVINRSIKFNHLCY